MKGEIEMAEWTNRKSESYVELIADAKHCSEIILGGFILEKEHGTDFSRELFEKRIKEFSERNNSFSVKKCINTLHQATAKEMINFYVEAKRNIPFYNILKRHNLEKLYKYCLRRVNTEFRLIKIKNKALQKMQAEKGKLSTYEKKLGNTILLNEKDSVLHKLNENRAAIESRKEAGNEISKGTIQRDEVSK